MPAAYTDVKRGHHLEGDLYCDEEGLLNAAPVHNWRASQMRYWHMLPRKTELDPNWRDYCHIAGDACFVVPATDENLKMMESILDSSAYLLRTSPGDPGPRPQLLAAAEKN